MKKIVTFVFGLLIFSQLSADLYKPHRKFEYGIDAEVEASNNNFKLADIMVKNLVLDVQKMADTVPSQGLILDFHMKEKFYVNMNFSSRMRMSIYAGVEAGGYLNLDKKLFDILSKGVSLYENKKFTAEVYTDVFCETGFSYQTLIKNFGVKIAPALYVPVVYVPSTEATATLSMSSDGKIMAKAVAPVSVYTVVDMEKFIEDGHKAKDININAGDILKSCGFDLAFEVERNFLEGLNASVFGRIPLIPSKLKHKIDTNLNAYCYETNALGVMQEQEVHDFDYSYDDFVYSSSSYNVFRPLKFGIQASYRPHGEWITIQPRLNIVLRDPYSSANRIIYPEYNLTTILSLYRTFGISAGSGYENRVFNHQLGIMLNFRAFEVDAKVGTCGADFFNSFKLSGASGYVGIKIGI